MWLFLQLFLYCSDSELNSIFRKNIGFDDTIKERKVKLMSFNFQQLRASLKRVLIVTLTTVLILCQFDMSALAVTRVDKNGEIVYSNVTGNVSGDVSGNPSPGDVSGNAFALKHNVSVAIGERLTLRLIGQEYWVYSDDGNYTVEKDLSRFDTRYEWYRENEEGELTPIDNSDSATYSVENCSAEDLGRYVARMYGTVGGKEIKFAERVFNVTSTDIGNIPDDSDFEFGVEKEFKPVFYDENGKIVESAKFEISYAYGFDLNKDSFGKEGTTLVRTNRKNAYILMNVTVDGEYIGEYELNFRFPDYKEYNFGEIKTRAFTDSDFQQDFSISHIASANQRIDYQVSLFDEDEEDAIEIDSSYYKFDKEKGILRIPKNKLERLKDEVEYLRVTYSVSVNGYLVRQAEKWLDIMDPLVIPDGEPEPDSPSVVIPLSSHDIPSEMVAINTTGKVLNSDNPYGTNTTLRLKSISVEDSSIIRIEPYDRYSYALYGLERGSTRITRVYQYGNENKTITDVDLFEVYDSVVSINPEELFIIAGQTQKCVINPKIWTDKGWVSPEDSGKDVRIKAKPVFAENHYLENSRVQQEVNDHSANEFITIKKSGTSFIITAKKPLSICECLDDYHLEILFSATVNGKATETMQDSADVYIYSDGIILFNLDEIQYGPGDSISIKKDVTTTIELDLSNLYFNGIDTSVSSLPIDSIDLSCVDCYDENYDIIDPDIDVTLTDDKLRIKTNELYEEGRKREREIAISFDEYTYSFYVSVDEDAPYYDSFNLEDCTITGIVDKEYTGKPIYQFFKITNKYGDSLVKNLDYNISYKNNRTPGLATMTIKGIGNYQGTMTKTFNIIGSGSSGGGSSGGDIGGGSSGGDVGGGSIGGGGAGGGGGIAPSEPEDNTITNTGSESAGDALTNVDAKDNTTVTEGKAETKVDADLGSKIVENAVENKSTGVVIKAQTEQGSSSASTVALPASTINAIAEKTEASVTIKTDSAEVSLDKTALDAVAEKAGTSGDVKLVIETKEQNKNKVVIELKLETSNGAVSDFKGGNATVTVPVSEELAGKKIVCVYIDENGKYTKMEGKLTADGKSYTFTTGHFSTYAILEEAEADAVIDEQNKAEAPAVKVAKASVKLKAYKGGKLKVTASAKNATGYRVYYKKSTWKKYKTYTKGNIKTLNKTFKKLAKGKYTVKVKAYHKAADGKVTWGTISNAKKITVR